MPWRCAALEDLDDDHATAAAWATAREGRLVAIMIIGIGSLALGLLATEQEFLDATLAEEKKTDEALTQLAERNVNQHAEAA